MLNPNLNLTVGDYAPFALTVARRLGTDDEDVSDRFLAALVAAGTSPMKGGPTPLKSGDPLAVVKAMANGAAIGKAAQTISVPTVLASSLCQEGEDGEMESEDECLERVGLDEVLLQVMDDWDDPESDALGTAEEYLDQLNLRLDLAPHNRLTSVEVAKLQEYLLGKIATVKNAIAEYQEAAFQPRGDVENPAPLYPFILNRDSDDARARYKAQVEAGLAGPIEWLSDPMELCGENVDEDSSDVQTRDKSSDGIRVILTHEGHEGHVHLNYDHERLPANWVKSGAFAMLRDAWGKPKFAETLCKIVRGSRLDDEQNLAELLRMLASHLVNTRKGKDLALYTRGMALLKDKKKGKDIKRLEWFLGELDNRLAREDGDGYDKFYDAALPALGLDWDNAYLESADWGEGVAADANDAGLGDVSDILWPDPDPASDEYTIPEMEWGSVDLKPLLDKIQSFGGKGWQSAVWMRAFIPVFASGARFEEANAAGKAAWMKANHFTPKPVGVRPVVSMGASTPPKSMFAGYAVI